MFFSISAKTTLLATFLALSGCAATQKPDLNAAQDCVNVARARFVPDRKAVLFECIPCEAGLCVTTTSSEVATFLAGKPGVVTRLLPNDTTSVTPSALVRVPLAPIHRTNRFSSEIVTEAVMGTPVKLLEHDGWWRVQTPDGYSGWIHPLQLTLLTPEQRAQWAQAKRLVVTSLNAEVFEKPAAKDSVTELPNGALIVSKSTAPARGYVQVELPDRRTGWMKLTDVSDLAAFEFNAKKLASNPTALRDRFADNALRLMGRSYRWAGATPWAMDCSGLVRAALVMTGFIAPRDSDQLVNTGERLDADAPLQKGDLLFFGETSVSHVAVSLGGTRFVHSLGDVHVGDLNPDAPHYIDWAKRTFLFAVRPRLDTGCIIPVADVPLVNGASLAPLICPKKP